MSETKIEVKCSKSGGDDKNGCGCKCHRVPVTLRDHFWKDPFFSSNWEDFDKIRKQVKVEFVKTKLSLSIETFLYEVDFSIRYYL